MGLDRDRLIRAVGAVLASLGTSVCPVSLRVTVLRVLGGRGGTAASGRGAEFSDPGEHDGEQVVAGWQPQRQPASVMDQPGGDAEQFVAQSGGVRAAVLVDPGECLEQGREVPCQQRGPHPHGVHALIARGELAECGAELGLADAVLDIGAAANHASTSRIVSALPVVSPGRSLAGMLVTMNETA